METEHAHQSGVSQRALEAQCARCLLQRHKPNASPSPAPRTAISSEESQCLRRGTLAFPHLGMGPGGHDFAPAAVYHRGHERRRRSRGAKARCAADQPRARGRAGRLFQDAGPGAAALRHLSAQQWRAQGHGLPGARAHRIHREIFRDDCRFSEARLCRRHFRLARTGRFGPADPQSPARLCAALRRLLDRFARLSRQYPAARLSRAVLSGGPFDGGAGLADRGDARPDDVRPHLFVRADGGARPPAAQFCRHGDGG